MASQGSAKGTVGDMGHRVLCKTCWVPYRLRCVLLLEQKEDVPSAGLHLCAPVQGFGYLLGLLELCRRPWLRVVLPSRLLLDGGLMRKTLYCYYHRQLIQTFQK